MSRIFALSLYGRICELDSLLATENRILRFLRSKLDRGSLVHFMLLMSFGT